MFYIGSFGVGTFLYQDPGRSTPLTGYTYVVLGTSGGHSGTGPTGNVFTLDPTTGEILSDTGGNCTTNNVSIANNRPGAVMSSVTGISGFTFGSPLSSGGSQMGTHGSFTGTIAVTLSAGPTSASNLYLSGAYAQTIPISAGGSGTYTFSSNVYLSTDQIIIALAV